jgi:hypothetical protein
LIGAGLVAGLLRREARSLVAFFVAGGCLYEGWIMFPVLTHAVALTTPPTRVAQLAVAGFLGIGAGLFAVSVYEGKR